MARNLLLRTMTTLTRETHDQAISYISGGAVAISYPTLVSSPLSLRPSIGEVLRLIRLSPLRISDDFASEQAFGSHPESLGILVVRDLPPSYAVYRERLLKQAYKFAKLDESVREKYTDPASRYR
jgi:hypothetical protein